MSIMDFRAWNKVTKEFIYFNTPIATMSRNDEFQVAFEYTKCSKIMFNGYSDIEQYTGRNGWKKTKEYPDGQKIYGGDIVIGENFWGKFGPQEVIWDRECSAWIVPCTFSKSVKAPFDNYQNFLHQLWDLEVVGNIHEPFEFCRDDMLDKK